MSMVRHQGPSGLSDRFLQKLLASVRFASGKQAGSFLVCRWGHCANHGWQVLPVLVTAIVPVYSLPSKVDLHTSAAAVRSTFMYKKWLHPTETPVDGIGQNCVCLSGLFWFRSIVLKMYSFQPNYLLFIGGAIILVDNNIEKYSLIIRDVLVNIGISVNIRITALTKEIINIERV